MRGGPGLGGQVDIHYRRQLLRIGRRPGGQSEPVGIAGVDEVHEVALHDRRHLVVFGLPVEHPVGGQVTQRVLDFGRVHRSRRR